MKESVGGEKQSQCFVSRFAGLVLFGGFFFVFFLLVVFIPCKKRTLQRPDCVALPPGITGHHFME